MASGKREVHKRNKLIKYGPKRKPIRKKPLSYQIGGTPEWLALELGVRGKDVRGLLRKRFPRPGKEKRKHYGTLPESIRDELALIIANSQIDN